LFSLLRNSSERNSGSFLFHETEFRVVFSSAEGLEIKFLEFLLFLLPGTEFRVVFSSAEGFGTEFREFSVPRNKLEFRRKEPFVPSFLSSAEFFVVGNSQPYSLTDTCLHCTLTSNMSL
jgi:hypothetical protein